MAGTIGVNGLMEKKRTLALAEGSSSWRGKLRQRGYFIVSS